MKKLNDKQIKLVEDNINLAYKRGLDNYRKYKQKFTYLRYTEDDFINIAYEALCRAAKNYDSEKGNAFTTYAYSYIDGIIKKEIFRNNSIIKVPRIDDINNKKRLNEKEKEDIKAYMFGSNGNVMYLDKNVVDKKDNNGRNKSMSQSNIVGYIDNNYGFVELMDTIRRSLNDEEYNFFILHYINGLTQKEIANIFGVSQTYISKRIISSRNKLKNELKEVV